MSIILSRLGDYMALIAAVSTAGAAVLLLLLLLRVRRSRREVPPLVLKVSLEDVQAVDTAASRILHEVSQWIPGRAFHAYWLSDDGSHLRLRASITQASNPMVAPNYSGLVNEETAMVPLSLPVEGRGLEPAVVGVRTERWLEVPIGRYMLVRALLGVQDEVPRPLLQRLREAGEAYGTLTAAVYEWFKAREASERASSLMDSARMALDTTLRPDKAIELLLRVAGHVVEAEAQCALVASADGLTAMSDTPVGAELGKRLLNGEAPALLVAPLEPDVVAGEDLGDLAGLYGACVRTPVLLAGEPLGCVFYFTAQPPEVDEYHRAVLATLAERVAHLVASQQQMEAASEGYLDTLRAVVDAFDGLSQYSVGHSDRLARYGRMTALELGLSEEEAEAIAVGAYFHDVGMVAVDPRVVLKAGRVTNEEMEKIKAHAELGGQMVTPIKAALPLDAIVACHHERWDGKGYPRGLSGEEIPLGARIIAVADLFDAKTTGRAYRAPRKFNEALEDLKAAGNSSLDPMVVEAFIAAWSKVRQRARSGAQAGRCWELKQLPEHVCAGCPNRTGDVLRCWENKANLCTRHGDTCETCFIYTEAVTRGMAPSSASATGR